MNRDVGDRQGYPARDENAKAYPVSDGEEFTDAVICGRSAFNSLEKTEIANITAGEEVGFKSISMEELYGASSAGGDVQYYHPGPGSIWLSRAPGDDLKSYEGDGDWFKIAYAGPKSDTEWELYNKSKVSSPGHSRHVLLCPDHAKYTVAIPKTTPPGKYLLRFEQFMPTPTFNYSQWYVNCALVDIKGPGGGTPAGFARLPGAYKPDDIGK